MPVKISSRSIIQFLEMFVDLGDQIKAGWKYICGFVKRGIKIKDDIYFCGLGEHWWMPVFLVGGVWSENWKVLDSKSEMQVLIQLKFEFLNV